MSAQLARISELTNKLPNRNLSLGVFLVNLLTLLAVFLLRGRIPPVVPLFYGRAYGVEQLAPMSSLAFPPIAALLISALNIFLSIPLKDDFLRKVLLAGAIVITTLSTITIVKIILLVGNL